MNFKMQVFLDVMYFKEKQTTCCHVRYITSVDDFYVTQNIEGKMTRYNSETEFADFAFGAKSKDLFYSPFLSYICHRI